MDLSDHWTRIIRWHEANTPNGFLKLRSGATVNDLDSFEQHIAAELPADFKESYLLYNGLDGSFLLHYGELLSLDCVIKEWGRYKQWQESDNWGLEYEVMHTAGVKDYWWSPWRIPITSNGGGDNVMLDLDPDDDGVAGQIVEHSHEIGPEAILAWSFAQWLRIIAEALENGEYIYNKDENTVLPVELEA